MVIKGSMVVVVLADIVVIVQIVK